MDGIKLSPDILNERGNRENEKRGRFVYISSKGWKGFGLKVCGKYDNRNNDQAYNGNPNEQAIAYNGIGAGGSCKTVEEATNKIYKGGFIAGDGQVLEEYKNILIQNINQKMQIMIVVNNW